MKKILFILTLSILAQAGLFAQEEGLRSRLERDSILIGDQVRWSAPLTLEQGEEFAFVPPQEPVAPGVETIVGFGIDTLLGTHLHVGDEFIIAPITLEDNVVVGAHSLIGPGVTVKAGEATKTMFLAPPFSVWKDGKRIVK